ncbi:hypothetical protein [Streptomyces sp. NPDC017524]|uniref:hypothetical protein n=1 Tax=Streptomyces sp. NPDC017524 TaxID=3364999 RepID=UPI00379AB38D
MFECFRSGAGEILTRADYLADFGRVHQGDINLLAKIERGQTFKEQGSPSWDAFASGDWAGALRLIENERDAIAAYFRDAAHLPVRNVSATGVVTGAASATAASRWRPGGGHPGSARNARR